MANSKGMESTAGLTGDEEIIEYYTFQIQKNYAHIGIAVITILVMIFLVRKIVKCMENGKSDNNEQNFNMTPYRPDINEGAFAEEHSQDNQELHTLSDINPIVSDQVKEMMEKYQRKSPRQTTSRLSYMGSARNSMRHADESAFRNSINIEDYMSSSEEDEDSYMREYRSK